MHGLEMAEAPKPDKPKPILAAKPSYTVTNLDTLFDDHPEQHGPGAKGADVSDMSHARFPNTPFLNQKQLKRDAQISRQRRVNLMIGAAILLIAVFFLATLGASLFTKEASTQQPTPPSNATANVHNVESEDTGDDARARIDSDEDSGSRATAQAHSASPEPLEDEETVPTAEDPVVSPKTRREAEVVDDASTTGHSSVILP
ncbi:hypothetical protein MTO96_026117 [Rhipicephalus appendiculatus]